MRMQRSNAEQPHEVTVALHHFKAEAIASEIEARTTPGSPLYQQWLIYDEVGDQVRDRGGFEAVRTWLSEAGANIIWHSPHLNYIRASASISVWEALLKTEFYEWESTTSERTAYTRAESYSIPQDLSKHIAAIFNTCQIPAPVYSHFAVKRAYSTEDSDTGLKRTELVRNARGAWETSTTVRVLGTRTTTVNSLSQYYNINSNKGGCPALLYDLPLMTHDSCCDRKCDISTICFCHWECLLFPK